MSTIDKTLEERGARYGDFAGHAEVTQALKDAMQAHDGWDGLADDQKEALEMVAHKVGRILNGDPNYIDSWTDIIGYTRLVEKRLLNEQVAQVGLTKDTTQETAEKVKEATKEVRNFGDLVRVLDKILGDGKCDDPECEACYPKANEPEDELTRKLRELFGPNVEVRRVD